MTTTRTERRVSIGQYITMDDTITFDNNITQEIDNTIQSGNHCCCVLQNITISTIIFLKTKIKIYQTKKKPLINACET